MSVASVLSGVMMNNGRRRGLSLSLLVMDALQARQADSALAHSPSPPHRGPGTQPGTAGRMLVVGVLLRVVERIGKRHLSRRAELGPT